MIEELEDEIYLLNQNFSRLEVNMQALRSDYEKNIGLKDADAEDKRRELAKQLRDMELELDDERRAKQNALSGKKKLESTAAELQQQLDSANHAKEDAMKHLKKLTVSLSKAMLNIHRYIDLSLRE